jgi:hypothetical protein
MAIYLTPRGKRVVPIAAIVIVLIISLAGYYIYTKQNEYKTANNPVKAKEVAEDLAKIVSKIYQVPNETPTIATVVDVKDLPLDPFYKDAKEGDKILIFEAYQQVLLYRPSENKIIAVGSMAPDPSLQGTEVAGAATEASPSAENGTVNQQVEEQAPNIIFQPVNQ